MSHKRFDELLGAIDEVAKRVQATHDSHFDAAMERARRLLVSALRRRIDEVQDDALALRAYRLITPFERAIETGDVRGLPKPHVVEGDGSLSIEWALRDRRLGFVLGDNTDDSSWFVVYRDYPQRASSYGPLYPETAHQVIEGFLE